MRVAGGPPRHDPGGELALRPLGGVQHDPLGQRKRPVRGALRGLHLDEKSPKRCSTTSSLRPLPTSPPPSRPPATGSSRSRSARTTRPRHPRARWTADVDRYPRKSPSRWITIHVVDMGDLGPSSGVMTLPHSGSKRRISACREGGNRDHPLGTTTASPPPRPKRPRVNGQQDFLVGGQLISLWADR